MAKILIVGCGDLGSRVGQRLVAEGDEVWGLRRNVAALPEGVQPWRADLKDKASLRDLPVTFERILFTASAGERSEAAYRAVYVEGLRNVIEAFRSSTSRKPDLIFVSSTSVYGQDRGEWVDESSATEPASFSGRIMLEAEALAAEKCERAISVRFSGIYGPGRTRLIRRIAAGEALRHLHYTNRIHIEDCVGVLLHLLAEQDAAPIYVASDDQPSSLGEVSNWIAERLGREAPPSSSEETSGKRCNNQLLKASGYRFRYPTYKEGYAALIRDR